jgi:hypothetical protein
MRDEKMHDADMTARLKQLYLPPAQDFVLVDVPEMRFVMIDGQGAPDRAALDHAVKWLFAAIYPIKRIARERMGKDSSNRRSKGCGGRMTSRISSAASGTS